MRSKTVLRPQTAWRWLTPVLVLPLALLAARQGWAAEDGDVAALERGKKLYYEARDPASEAEVMARVGGEDGIDVPAWTLPCVTCHGAKGKGGLPGHDVPPPDIRWPALRAEATTASGRKRPAYADAAAIGRAVIEGRDAADQSLSAIMPRYRLDESQWAALAAYMKSLTATD